MYNVTNPFRLINKEDVCKYTQKQHDTLRNNYNKIYILEGEIEKYIINFENIENIENIIKNKKDELEKINIMQNAIIDFMSNY